VLLAACMQEVVVVLHTLLEGRMAREVPVAAERLDISRHAVKMEYQTQVEAAADHRIRPRRQLSVTARPVS